MEVQGIMPPHPDDAQVQHYAPILTSHNPAPVSAAPQPAPSLPAHVLSKRKSSPAVLGLPLGLSEEAQAQLSIHLSQQRNSIEAAMLLANFNRSSTDNSNSSTPVPVKEETRQNDSSWDDLSLCSDSDKRQPRPRRYSHDSSMRWSTMPQAFLERSTLLQDLSSSSSASSASSLTAAGLGAKLTWVQNGGTPQEHKFDALHPRSPSNTSTPTSYFPPYSHLPPPPPHYTYPPPDARGVHPLSRDDHQQQPPVPSHPQQQQQQQQPPHPHQAQPPPPPPHHPYYPYGYPPVTHPMASPTHPMMPPPHPYHYQHPHAGKLPLPAPVDPMMMRPPPPPHPAPHGQFMGPTQMTVKTNVKRKRHKLVLDDDDMSNAIAPGDPDFPDMSPRDVEAARVDPEARPRRQKLRFHGDKYTPQWVRFLGQTKEGLCDTCQPGKWLQLKNSAFWYHKQFYHGISSVSGVEFIQPLETRWVDQDMVEGLCHQCHQWVHVSNVKRKNSVLWYRHAHKCHVYHKPKPTPGRPGKRI